MVKLHDLRSIAAGVAAMLSLASLVNSQAGQVRTVGNSGVSAQMTFLASPDHVYFIDKAENNPLRIGNRPAWAARYNYATNQREPTAIKTNTFCAGGAPMGNGNYLMAGGTRSLGYGADDGGFAINIYNPASNSWEQRERGLQRNRWYPTVEPLADGSVIVIGGQNTGGFVPTEATNEASYEYWPSKGAPIGMDILRRTLPLNLYPITFLMSNGKLFIVSGRQATLWDLGSQSEDRLPNIPDVPRPYPANAAAVMLPMRVEDGYQQRILICGGMSLGSKEAWGDLDGPRVSLTDKYASKSCQQMTPLGSRTWQAIDDLPSGRSMGMFIHLPNGEILFVGGVTKGTAGYKASGDGPARPVGQSFGDAPSYQAYIFNPSAPAGQKWRAYGTLPNARLYHSSATLLPDGSVLISGSNPNEDVTTRHWATSYTVDRWYGPYYDDPRPSNAGLPDTFPHGGGSIRISVPGVKSGAHIRIIRTGFSTHGINYGQRSIQLGGTLNGDTLVSDGMPQNANIFPPGPALAFVVVDGIPSQGKFVQIGSRNLPAADAISGESTVTDSMVAASNAQAVQSSGEGGLLSAAAVNGLGGEAFNTTSAAGKNDTTLDNEGRGFFDPRMEFEVDYNDDQWW